MSIFFQMLQGMHALYTWRDKTYVCALILEFDLCFFICFHILLLSSKLLSHYERAKIDLIWTKIIDIRIGYLKNDCSHHVHLKCQHRPFEWQNKFLANSIWSLKVKQYLTRWAISLFTRYSVHTLLYVFLYWRIGVVPANFSLILTRHTLLQTVKLWTMLTTYIWFYHSKLFHFDACVIAKDCNLS
jgi:hypothetical protein